jgi:chemotaxis protein CheD
VSGLSDVGEKNGAFARDFLVREGIVLEGASLGGDYARRVQFWPATGRARQIRPSSPPPQLVQSELVVGKSKSAQKSGDLELF